MVTARHERPAFTLIDVLCATVIIGTAIAATMSWMASGTMANAQTGHMSIAVVLANNVHEYALTLDPGKPTGAVETVTPPTKPTLVLQLNKMHFDHPITSRGDQLAPATMPGWSLDTTVTSCPLSDLNPAVPPSFATTAATDLRRLTAKVSYQGKVVYSAVWLLSHSS
jgi:type II secretory pathway pseudopilin PulG